MITPYEGYVEVCEAARRADPGRPRQEVPRCSTPAPRPSRTPSRSPGYATGRTAVVAFDHAYHGRTNLTMALTAKAMPYKKGFGPFAARHLPGADVLPVPRPRGLTGEQAAARAIAMIEKQVGADNVAAVIIEPIQGEGGFVVPAPGFLPALADGARTTASSSSPTRSRPGSPAPAPGSPASTRASSPTWSPRQGHRRRAAARRGHRPGRADGRRPPRRPRRHLRRQPDRLRRGPRRDRDDARAGPHRRRPADRGAWSSRGCRPSRTRCPPSATSADAAACWRSSSSSRARPSRTPS